MTMLHVVLLTAGDDLPEVRGPYTEQEAEAYIAAVGLTGSPDALIVPLETMPPLLCTHRFGDICNAGGEHVFARYEVVVTDGRGTTYTEFITAWSAEMAVFTLMARYGLAFDPKATGESTRIEMVEA